VLFARMRVVVPIAQMGLILLSISSFDTTPSVWMAVAGPDMEWLADMAPRFLTPM
jgi:hypothetical protein